VYVSVFVFDLLVWEAMYISPKLRYEVGKLTLYFKLVFF